MMARSTLMLIALSFALVACDRTPADTETLELAEVATTAPVLDDTDVPAVADADDIGPIASAPTESVPDESAAVEEVPAEESLTVRFTLRHGETLHHYARWAGLPVETIADASDLDLSGSYAAGATVVVPITDEEDGATVSKARDAHHSKMAEGYLASRGGAIDAELVTVRTGDSATRIARDQQGIPLWLLQTYNPSVDLDRLRPGQELLVPVLADIVVDADQIPE